MSVKNGMPYLIDAVNSILNQSHTNFQFIIVDDASMDTTWRYLKSIKDKRIILIKNAKNLGLAASLNKALTVADGFYIARMDADDISLPTRIEVQVDFMQSHPKIDMCGTWVATIDQNSKQIGKIHFPKSDTEIKNMLRKIPPLIHPTWLVKSKIFKEMGGYMKHWDYVEDYDFLLRARKYKMANVNRELLLWRLQDKRRSTQNIQKMYLKSFQLRWKYFWQGKLDILYVPYLFRSIITTFVFPPSLKIYLNKKAGLS